MLEPTRRAQAVQPATSNGDSTRLGARIASNVFWTLVADGLLRVSIALVPLYVARVLSPQNFGLFSLAQVIGQYATIAMDLGGNSMYALRELAGNKDEASGIITRFLSVRCGSALATGLLASLIALLAVPDNQQLQLLIVFAGLYALAYAGFPDWAFRGLERMRYIAVGYVTVAGIYWAVVVLAVRSEQDTVAALIAWTASYALGGLASIIILRHCCGFNVRIRFPRVQDFLGWSSSLQFTVAGFLGVSLSQGIVLILGAIAGPTSAGLFAGPLRMALTASTAGVMITVSIYPVLAILKDLPDEFHHVLSTLTDWILLLVAPAAAVASVWASDFVVLVLGTQYSAASGILAAVVWTVPMLFLVSALEYAALALGNEGRRLIANVVAVIVLVVCSVVLIPPYAETGATLAYMLSIASLLLVLWIGVHGRRASLVSTVVDGIKMIGPTLALFAALSASRALHLGILGLVLALTGYVLAVISLGLARPSTLRSLSSSVRQRRGTRS